VKLGALWRSLTGSAGKGPSYPELPDVDARGETSVPGIYAVGELAGTPLVKLGLNAGHDVIQSLASELREPGEDAEVLDVVIVGSGSSGLAASVAAKDLGLTAVVIEAAEFANTFVTMTRGKILFAEPHEVSCRSRIWFEECTREELLARWTSFVEAEGLRIRTREAVTQIAGAQGDFTVHTSVSRYRCRRVLLCMGKAGNPRKLGVPGERENASRIHHRLADAADHVGEEILIVGAGDVACEAAIALAPHNKVTLAAIDTSLTYPKKRNADAIRALAKENQLTLRLSTSVTSLQGGVASLSSEGAAHQIPVDTVFVMIGAELPVQFLKDTGIRLNTAWQPGKWVALVASFLAVYCLYALKSYGKGRVAWPFEGLISPETYDRVLGQLFAPAFAPFAGLFEQSALVEIYADRGFQQGYLYSGLYTVAMLAFGFEALIRWRKYASNPRYQTWRYASLLSFQVGFFLLVNVVGVQYLSVKYAWRAWGLYQPFPLFFNTYFWWYPGDPKWLVAFFVGAGLFGTFVAIPWASRNHGKRFCTWICGCGGLAETLGDRWRHLAPKGERSRAWEFQGAVVLAAAVIVAVIVVGFYDTAGDNIWWKTYNYIVDFWLVAVIPIALYPFFGGKVWCRYWCPLAVYNGWLAAWYGRLQIVSNDKCITCTQCSKYCQVGIDVMAFAKQQEPLDNRNSSCIQCGICIDVCPVDVLSFDLRPVTQEPQQVAST
jgi:NosR/NirI family transcriptional regulator, nitrous oxide reductase regulator